MDRQRGFKKMDAAFLALKLFESVWHLEAAYRISSSASGGNARLTASDLGAAMSL